MGLRGVDDVVHKKMIELSNGMIVEEDCLRISQKIKEYDENLVLQFLDPAQADDITDPPYRVMEVCRDGLRRPVMDVWVLDERVLERLYTLDTQRVDVLAQLDANNAAAKLEQNRRYKMEIAAVNEMVQGVLASTKDTYTAINPVTQELHTFRSMRKSDD